MIIKRLLTGVTVAIGVALLTPGAWAQSSGNASASASATVITPIGVATDGSDLEFGSFEAGTGGTVIVTQAGGGSETGGVTRVPSGSATSAAGFDVVGENNFFYNLNTTGSDTVLTGPGSPGTDMGLALDVPASPRQLDGTGNDSFAVGGTLTVGAAPGQTAGAYSANITVNVVYQ